MTVWVGLDRGDERLGPAEHLAEAALGAALTEASLACTHLLDEPFGHYAVSAEFAQELPAAAIERLLQVPGQVGGAVVVLGEGFLLQAGEEAFVACSLAAASRNRARSEGRAFVYQGVGELTGTLCQKDLIERSAIQGVEALGSTSEPQSWLMTRDFVRPQLRAGRLVLVITPRADGSFQPFEVENPHVCCADQSSADPPTLRPATGVVQSSPV